MFAERYRRQLETLAQNQAEYPSELQAMPPLYYVPGPTQQCLYLNVDELPGDYFFAEITGNTGLAYSWKDRVESVAGTWVDGLLSGTLNAYYAQPGTPLSTVVAAGTVVLMRLSPTVDLTYEFLLMPTGGSSLTVKESDGTPSYSDITSLEFDQDDGFSLSQPGANRAKVNYGITVKESDGSPSYSPVTSLEFDSAYFIVSQPGAKRANVTNVVPETGQVGINATVFGSSYGTQWYSSGSAAPSAPGLYFFSATGLIKPQFAITNTGTYGIIEARFYNNTTAAPVGGLAHQLTEAAFGVVGANQWYDGAAWSSYITISAGDDITVQFTIAGDAASTYSGVSCVCYMYWQQIL